MHASAAGCSSTRACRLLGRCRAGGAAAEDLAAEQSRSAAEWLSVAVVGVPVRGAQHAGN